MRLGSSLLLIIIAATSLWFARDAFTPPDPQATPPATSEPLVSFSPSEVGQITITRQNETATISRDPQGRWRMDAPVNDRVDFQHILALLVSLNGMVIEDQFTLDQTPATPDQEPANAEEFRLADSAVDLTLSGRDGKEIAQLRIGGITPLSVDQIPTTYVQRLDSDYDDTIFVVGGNVRIIVDRPFDAWRDHRPLFLAHPPVSITISEGQRRIELTRESPQDEWHMDSPLNTRADQEAIATLLASLSEPIATEILREAPAPPSGNNTSPPSITIELAQSEANAPKPEPITLTLSPHPTGDSDSRLLRSNDRDVSLVVPSPTATAFKLDATRYRSRQLVDLDPTEVYKVIARDPASPAHTSVLRRRGREWEVMLRNEWTRANDKLVFDTITALNETQITHFSDDAGTDLEAYGLDAPVLQAAFFPLDDQNPLRINLGTKNGKTFAKIDGKPFIYEVPDATRFQIPVIPGSWQSLSLFDFSSLDIRLVNIRQKGWPDLALRYAFMDGQWYGLLGEEDVTAMINVAAAHQMGTTLERMRAVRWSVAPNAEVYQMLNDPVLSVTTRIVPTDVDGTEFPAQQYSLDLAPMSENSPYWYGRINRSRDVFLIDAATIADLLPQSLLSPQ
ncbi:DUF4340 domain-containing protein [Sulfuriroseicoccus oceanibius]|uniref:DUF4340 domain-containing protein n=1 Tax=Sulfuriroseicoccus oceanibius TaxID=2707525 RepID=A0A6B3L8Y0_9BACT|nr:DUF4340 domain-containing protein [Sulfuriroseicoccus oceanibius]QQL44373.1 DUF4340 domain-containing protein [Sulfuriroseicoccus oceanibius]